MFLLKLFLTLLLVNINLILCSNKEATDSSSSINKPNQSDVSSNINANDGNSVYSTTGTSININEITSKGNELVNTYEVTSQSVYSKDKVIDEITYDQRQNGTQNVRIHLDDVTLIVAPSEGIMTLFAQSQSTQGGNQPIGSSGAGVVDGNQQTSGTGSQKEKPNKNDPYNDFDELISSANFLKNTDHNGKPYKKCQGDSCKGKRNKYNLSRLIPLLANHQHYHGHYHQMANHEQTLKKAT